VRNALKHAANWLGAHQVVNGVLTGLACLLIGTILGPVFWVFTRLLVPWWGWWLHCPGGTSGLANAGRSPTAAPGTSAIVWDGTERTALLTCPQDSRLVMHVPAQMLVDQAALLKP